MEKKKLSPMKANTNKKVCSIKTDNHSTAAFWIMSGENEVTLTEQSNGKESKTTISIPKPQFNKLIKWYIREQVIIRK